MRKYDLSAALEDEVVSGYFEASILTTSVEKLKTILTWS